MQPIILGRSDFASLRSDGGLYVDKSSFISEVLSRPPDIQLYPRPRRFGKTMGLSMLRYFLERGEDRSGLFSDLSIWQNPDARKHFGRYPVIYLTFKDIKHTTWAEAKSVLLGILSHEVERHLAGMTAVNLSPLVRQALEALVAGTGDPSMMLKHLTEALHTATGERVVVLMDEYDAPLLTAWQYNYYDDAAGWFRAFLTAGLKDNAHLFKGVLTGILRVAKESMFSGLNNVAVYSLLARQEEPFGFTEQEVNRLLKIFGREAEIVAVRDWYNGYRFGETTVYNPWSILNMLGNPREPLRPWWLNTSDNALVKELLLGRTELGSDIEALLRGELIEREIEENVPLRDLHGDHVWSLLLFSGYLKVESLRVEEGIALVTLKIPNQEVRGIWRSTFVGWLQAGMGRLEPLHRALLDGNATILEDILTKLLLKHTSEHDVKSNQDEAFYHAFVLGLLVSMERSHTVRSNREVGYGRSDVVITPKRAGDPGVVLEFKKLKTKRTLVGMAEEALKQIDQQKYAAELEDAGVSPIRKIGIAFSGKRVAVRCA